MLRRVARAINRPVSRMLLRTVRAGRWERLAYHVPLKAYGAGSVRQFDWYFAGESRVPCQGVACAQHFLLDCAYQTDSEHFYLKDYWQHPLLFERLQRGDCEDFSLWTWRRLVEAGLEAEFVAGWSVRPGEDPQGHTWVQFKNGAHTYLFDTVIRDSTSMVRRLEEAAPEYVPQVSVDGALQRYVYGGYLCNKRSNLDVRTGDLAGKVDLNASFGA